MSKDEAIPLELLNIKVPEGVPKETGFFEITGTATSEKVSSRVYAWFLDREKNPVLAPLFCDELLRVAQEKLDDASVAERLALGKYECELEVTTSSQKRIDILLRDTEARLAIIIENKIHADLINDLLDYWNHVSYPETQKIGILLTLHPTEVPEDFKSIFINVTHSEWIMAVESAGVPTGIPLHTYGMMTDFFNAIRNQSANSTMNDQARFFFDNPRLVIRARECLNEAISYIKGELREVAELFEFTSSFKYYGYCYLKDKKCSSDAVIAVHFEQLVNLGMYFAPVGKNCHYMLWSQIWPVSTESTDIAASLAPCQRKRRCSRPTLPNRSKEALSQRTDRSGDWHCHLQCHRAA